VSLTKNIDSRVFEIVNWRLIWLPTVGRKDERWIVLTLLQPLNLHSVSCKRASTRNSNNLQVLPREVLLAMPFCGERSKVEVTRREIRNGNELNVINEIVVTVAPCRTICCCCCCASVLSAISCHSTGSQRPQRALRK